MFLPLVGQCKVFISLSQNEVIRTKIRKKNNVMLFYVPVFMHRILNLMMNCRSVIKSVRIIASKEIWLFPRLVISTVFVSVVHINVQKLEDYSLNLLLNVFLANLLATCDTIKCKRTFTVQHGKTIISVDPKSR